MPRNGDGVYTLPAGNPVVSGEIVSSAWANTTMDDIEAALNDILLSTGDSELSGPLKLADGSLQAPGLTWTLEQNTGLHRENEGAVVMGVLGTRKMRWVHPTANPDEPYGIQLWNEQQSIWQNITALKGEAGATYPQVPQPEDGSGLPKLSPLDVVRYDGENWVYADASSTATLGLGVVVAADAQSFTLALAGGFQISHTLTPGEWYYLAADNPGKLTAVEPPVSQPIVYCLNEESIIIYAYRPLASADGTGAPGGGFVSTVFGRGGDVTAEKGDYILGLLGDVDDPDEAPSNSVLMWDATTKQAAFVSMSDPVDPGSPIGVPPHSIQAHNNVQSTNGSASNYQFFEWNPALGSFALSRKFSMPWCAGRIVLGTNSISGESNVATWVDLGTGKAQVNYQVQVPTGINALFACGNSPGVVFSNPGDNVVGVGIDYQGTSNFRIGYFYQGFGWYDGTIFWNGNINNAQITG